MVNYLDQLYGREVGIERKRLEDRLSRDELEEYAKNLSFSYPTLLEVERAVRLGEYKNRDGSSNVPRYKNRGLTNS